MPLVIAEFEGGYSAFSYRLNAEMRTRQTFKASSNSESEFEFSYIAPL